jgi:hypothetical protein
MQLRQLPFYQQDSSKNSTTYNSINCQSNGKAMEKQWKSNGKAMEKQWNLKTEIWIEKSYRLPRKPFSFYLLQRIFFIAVTFEIFFPPFNETWPFQSHEIHKLGELQYCLAV